MKVSVNKEFLLKHRFWLLLALVLPFACGALGLLVTTVRAGIEAEKDKLKKAREKADKEAKMLLDVRTPEQIDALKKQVEILSAMQNDIHERAYKEQAFPSDDRPTGIYTWPDAMESEFECTHVPASKNHPEKGLFAEVIRVNDDKTAPAENDPKKNIVHGKITEKKDNFIRVESHGKLYKFYETRDIKIFKAGGGKVYPQDLKKDMSLSVFFQTGKYFGDPLTDPELAAYRASYKSQVHDILKIVDPIDKNGKGRVRLGNWEYEPDTEPPADRGFIHYRKDFWPRDQNYSEDVWIAQENLWIQREIYSLINDANDSVAKFKVHKIYDKPANGKGKPLAAEATGKPAKDKGKKPAVEQPVKGRLPDSYVCTNPYWEINLKVIGEDTLKCEFTNLLPRGQKFDFELKIKARMPVEGKKNANDKDQKLSVLVFKPPSNLAQFNPFGYNADKGVEGDYKQVVKELKASADDKNDPVDLTKMEIVEVWQELTWESSAVRRIDGIFISSVAGGDKGKSAESHRDFPNPLKSYIRPDGAAAAPAPPPVPGGKVDPKKADAGVKKGIFGNAVTETKNGQIRERYTVVERQLFRRLPVAVVLTVEQGHIDRVQAAFNNSRLRFLTEQVIPTHTTGSLRPKAATKESGGSKVVGPITGPGTGPVRSGEELEANMELVIYGTITIYERFPGRLTPPSDWK